MIREIQLKDKLQWEKLYKGYADIYTVEMNDIAIYALQNHSSEEILHRGKLQFDRLYSEGDENARIMAISIHPYITGVPHRIAALEALFDYIIDHEDVVWMTAKEIGDWFNAQHIG